MTRLQRTCLGLSLAVILAAGLMLLSGCNGRYTKGGPVLTEQGRVADLPYVPSGHGSGSGFAINSKGGLSPTFTSVSIPARYAIVFECTHGRFVIEGHAELWKRLHVGELVDIHYYEILEGDDDTPAHATGLKFLDATPRAVER
jgi:hypothetical protein